MNIKYTYDRHLNICEIDIDEINKNDLEQIGAVDLIAEMRGIFDTKEQVEEHLEQQRIWSEVKTHH